MTRISRSLRPLETSRGAGDFVFGPKHLWHHLEPVGTTPSIRVAINARGEFHRYDRPGCKPL